MGRPAQHCAFRHRVIDRGAIAEKGCFRCGNEKTKLGYRGNGVRRGQEMTNAAISVSVAGVLSLLIVVMSAFGRFFAHASGQDGRATCAAKALPCGLCRGFAQAVETDRGGALSSSLYRGASRHTVVVVKGLHHQLWQQGEEHDPSQCHLPTEGAERC